VGRRCSGSAALLVVGLALFSAPAWAAEQFHSGIYEELLLAVNPAGQLTGFYRESQGQDPAKSCAFNLAGQAEGGDASIVTWDGAVLPGSLKAAANGVVLSIERGREHPGCGLVLPPLIAQGMPLDLVGAADWRSLERIATAKAYLQKAPNGTLRGAYLVHGDVVGVIADADDWLSVEYVTDAGKRIKGWLRLSELEELKPP
jgi:hypothetical protein